MTALSLEKAPVQPRYVEVGDIGLNSTLIPGGVGGVHLDEPVTVADTIRFTPEDGRWDQEPIGTALALEMAGKE